MSAAPDLRLSVTALDGLAWWRRSETRDLADFADRLCGIGEETPAMRMGSHFEDALLGGVSSPEWDFDGEAPRLSVVGRQSLSTLDVGLPDGRLVEMRGRVDGLAPGAIVEVKTTSTSIDLERYASSWQWRCYLAALGMRVCRYLVFRLSPRRGEPVVDVSEWREMIMRPYPGMTDDIGGAVADLAGTVDAAVRAGLVRIDAAGRPRRTRKQPWHAAVRQPSPWDQVIRAGRAR